MTLASEGTTRVCRFDVLHALVEGLLAQPGTARRQRYRILAPHGWRCGPQRHFPSSARRLGKVMRRHGRPAGLTLISDDTLTTMAAWATQVYPRAPSCHGV